MSYVPPTPPPAVTGVLVNNIVPYVSTIMTNVAHTAQEQYKTYAPQAGRAVYSVVRSMIR
ncbi:hypothetical protein SLUN_28535 [Streptomyces lunaelactis]|uniref:Uncharacterized protein n=1 Tax=Streptomyces lunaelactis TaxID=1535768 RepID=A0A2R4T8X5_9ACTN|nr:hypothetical protein [Streptomyces lunaelactis]AVZ75567.1 hypothetical protein SLUN_28535 [Streptomyces lunaelactis]NUK09490.1 hypothetical protein [Streptomyces lunaelactis]NUK73367.1 hypothetical protein [Streptomyces lunaelactis]NUK87916.1 hypothetical protein [Streptomyces lunaelactis]NUL10926.1 hypothetical protein [Streptomyces lunaelactis]